MAEQKSQRGANLTQADRERGGRVSAAKQQRDARGKFAGTKGAKRTHEQHQEHESQREHPQSGGSSHHGTP
jgi:hypothetical protein